MKENTLMAIDNIANTTLSSEVHVCECIAEFYSKAFLIMENYQGTDMNNFSLFQESEIIDKAIGKDKENESVITKITHFIPRLIQAIIDTIKVFIKKFRYQRHRRIEQKEIQKAMALQLVSDPKYIEDKLEKIGCKGKMSLREKMLSVKIFDMNKAIEFKDDVGFQISEDGILKVLFPYYKIDQIKSFNTKIDRQIANAKLSFKKKSDDAIIDALKNINKCFKGIATNQARIGNRKFKTIAEWDKFIDDVLDTFDVFSDKLKILKKMFEDMGVDVDNMQTAVASLIDDLRKLTSKTSNDTILISKLNEKIHEVFDVLTNPKSDFIKKRKFEKFKYNPPSQQDFVNMFHIDNTHLLNAIDKFNEFYEECITTDGLVENINEKATNSPIYKSAIEELNKQFNIKLEYSAKDAYKKTGASTMPWVGREDSDKIVVSRTKGFDCGGMKVTIQDEISDDAGIAFASGRKIFGQLKCSTLCHEIFHNILWVNDDNSDVIGKEFNKLLSRMKSSVYDAYTEFISNLAKSNNIPSAIVDDLEQQICNVAAYLVPKVNTDDFDKACQDVVDDKPIPKADPDNVREIRLPTLPDDVYTHGTRIIGLVICIVTLKKIIGFIKHGGAAPIEVISTVGTLCKSFKKVVTSKTKADLTSPEESLCDLFAAMYQLPAMFSKSYTISDMKHGIIRNGLSNLNSKLDVHPNTFDRMTVSYELAKQLLDSGEVRDPQLKEYLDYIVDVNSAFPTKERILTKRQIKKHAPTYTDDMNDTVNDLVKSLKINVTEYMTIDTSDDDIIYEE